MTTMTTDMTTTEAGVHPLDPPGHPAPGTPGRALERVSVAVYAEDLILRTGVVQQLRTRPEIELIPDEEADRAQVSLVVVDVVNEAAVQLLHRLQRNTATRT